ncbi:DoxX protein [Corynebacterium mycetoides]|uniref:DoxX protein n=1 Tax=Corynebacterium mycetoides TaxID=38302 RepID=A0A1G9LGU2_9CORY|nr:DoxX family protein [Corynebacterium mycetoides]SDL61094.1 DoxX protein [Corynebacterium mycetoides]
MTTFKNISLLLSRVLLGVILIPHGWQRFNEWTLAGTSEAFAGMGVPAPGLTSAIAATVELVGAIAAASLALAAAGAGLYSVDALLNNRNARTR